MLLAAAGSGAALELPNNDCCNHGPFRLRGLALNSTPRCKSRELSFAKLAQPTGHLGTPASPT